MHVWLRLLEGMTWEWEYHSGHTRSGITLRPNKINYVFPVAKGMGKIRVDRSGKYFILFKNFILTNS